jgi:hypothetical protein
VPEATARVEGIDRLVRTLKRAGVDISELKEAHMRAARLVASAASSRAPRRTGHLAGNVRTGRSPRHARVLAGSARVPYAGPIHWGWPARRIAAQPFISEAAEQTESSWAAGYVRDVIAALGNVKGA